MSNSLDPDQDLHSDGLDLIPTVCKGYQQMTKVPAGKERVKVSYHLRSFTLKGLKYKSVQMNFTPQITNVHPTLCLYANNTIFKILEQKYLYPLSHLVQAFLHLPTAMFRQCMSLVPLKYNIIHVFVLAWQHCVGGNCTGSYVF